MVILNRLDETISVESEFECKAMFVNIIQLVKTCSRSSLPKNQKAKYL